MEVMLSFFLRASVIADAAILALVANGMKMKAMKKEGIFAAFDRFWTLWISGSATTPSIKIPRITRDIAFIHAPTDLSTIRSSITLSVSSHFFYKYN